MKTLVIQIPCYNEAGVLAATIAELPKIIAGVDRIQTLVIDDGSTDETAAVARSAGVKHVIHLPRHVGLARAFEAGLTEAVAMGADIIVTMDGDGQHRGSDIARLIEPIQTQRADMVIGVRTVQTLLHRLGSVVVGIVSGLAIRDPVSGFRAFSRSAALRLRVYSSYTYTLETVIQAGRQGMRVATVPITSSGANRPSRLVTNVPVYVCKQAWIILCTWIRYRSV